MGKLLGKGAYGSVNRARMNATKKEYAIKTVAIQDINASKLLPELL